MKNLKIVYHVLISWVFGFIYAFYHAYKSAQVEREWKRQCDESEVFRSKIVRGEN